MSEWPKYHLRIGAHSPNTMPLGRLLEYLDSFRKLVSDDTKVHLVDIDDGSTKPAFLVDPDYADTFRRELLDTSNGIGSDKQIAAFNELNYLSAEDGKPSQVQGPDGRNVIEFPGAARPVKNDHGTISGIKKATTIFAIPYKVGRKKANSQKYDIWMTDVKNGQVIPKVTASVEIGVRLGAFLEQSLSVTGNAELERSADGEWRVASFDVIGFDPFDLKPANDTFSSFKGVAHSIPEDIQDRLSRLREGD